MAPCLSKAASDLAHPSAPSNNSISSVMELKWVFNNIIINVTLSVVLITTN